MNWGNRNRRLAVIQGSACRLRQLSANRGSRLKQNGVLIRDWNHFERKNPSLGREFG